MMSQFRLHARPAKPLIRAFTRLGLIAVVAVLLVLGLLFWGGLVNARAKAQRVNCANNLRQVGVGFRLFATDHGDRFPMEVATDRVRATNWAPEVARCFRALSNQLVTPKLLVCPADKRKPATDFGSLDLRNVSYFLGLNADEAWPQMFLAGDRNLTTNGVPVGPGLVEVSDQSALGWTKAMHNGAGNVVVSDGSVQQVSGPRLRALGTNGTAAQRLVVP